MWDFYHPPQQSILAERYHLHLTSPAACAQQLLSGEADLGLVPVAALTGDLRVVPGCTIASLHRVRSIQLIVKASFALEQIRTIATDTASRSSVAYAQILFRHFLGTDPEFRPAPADPESMLRDNDAALLIGDPALLALERRADLAAHLGPCLWYDLAEQWRLRTGLPWVAAVWAVRPEAVPAPASRLQLIADLNASRDHGLAHIHELIEEWTPRIALSPTTIRTYLTENIYYQLDAACVRAIQIFRQLAAQVNALEPLPELHFLGE